MLDRIHLQHFRCFTELKLTLNGTVLITGENAQGKTSILEAICVLLRLQSPRAGTKASLWQQIGSSWCAISGHLELLDLKYAQQGAKRKLYLNETLVTRPSEYLTHGELVVWLGNEDIQLVQGSSEIRRRYLDFIGLQIFPEYRLAYKACEKALKLRNALLKRDAEPPWDEIDAITRYFCEHAGRLTQFRNELVDLLNPEIEKACAQVSGNSDLASIQYHPSAHPEELEARIHQDRARELRLRVTSYGPHRDDFTIHLNQMDASRFASEGQQRTLAIAMKLAQAFLLDQRPNHSSAILLIDDVFGELDRDRRVRLLEALPVRSQKLITTTSLNWIECLPKDAEHFRLDRGELFST